MCTVNSYKTPLVMTVNSAQICKLPECVNILLDSNGHIHVLYIPEPFKLFMCL